MFAANAHESSVAGSAGRGVVSFAPAFSGNITPLALTLGSLPLPATRLTTG